MANHDRVSAVIARTERIEAATRAERERMSAVRKPRATTKVRVHNPYGHGIDHVEKIIDTISAMFKRRQLSELQFQAGQRLQIAYEVVYGQAGGSMDFGRTRGGSTPGQMPAEPYMLASELLRKAKQKLYPRDYAVTYRVCVQGLKIEDCGEIFGRGREGRLEAGRALRRALDELAHLWWPVKDRVPRPSVYRSEKSKAGAEGIIEVPNGVYHTGP